MCRVRDTWPTSHIATPRQQAGPGQVSPPLPTLTRTRQTESLRQERNEMVREQVANVIHTQCQNAFSDALTN